MGNQSQSSIATESKQNDDEIQKESFDADKFNINLDEVNNSLFQDPSIGNVVFNFAKTLLPPDLTSLDASINIMQTNWMRLQKMCLQLRELVGDEEMDDLDAIKNEYRNLLLKTRKVVRKLVVSSKLQKENAQQLLQVIESFDRNKQKFTYQEELAYNDCMSCLAKWIDQKDLLAVIEGWGGIITKLQAKSKVWAEFKKLTKKACIAAVVGCLAVAAVVAAVVVVGIGISVATHGAAAAGVAPVIKTVTVAGVGIAKSHLLAACALGAGAVALGGFAILSTEKMATYKLLKKAQQVQSALHEMLNVSEAMQEDLNGLRDKKDAVETHYEYLKHKPSFMKMKSGLNNIVNYLDEYTRQGMEIDGSINKAFGELRKLRY